MGHSRPHVAGMAEEVARGGVAEAREAPRPRACPEAAIEEAGRDDVPLQRAWEANARRGRLCSWGTRDVIEEKGTNECAVRTWSSPSPRELLANEAIKNTAAETVWIASLRSSLTNIKDIARWREPSPPPHPALFPRPPPSLSFGPDRARGEAHRP